MLFLNNFLNSPNSKVIILSYTSLMEGQEENIVNRVGLWLTLVRYENLGAGGVVGVCRPILPSSVPAPTQLQLG